MHYVPHSMRPRLGTKYSYSRSPDVSFANVCFAFGYGRRWVVTRHLSQLFWMRYSYHMKSKTGTCVEHASALADTTYADASLFINMPMVLYVFNITPPLDEHGKATHACGVEDDEWNIVM
ncbi:hypothetical protein C8Q74DRAFT_859195 [Fomes fomentarius]|nr:hypothetical protein C8Q74DRAFT_859195 [Fomes fomentarius]